MIRVPQVQQQLPDISGVFSGAGTPGPKEGKGLVPPQPAASQGVHDLPVSDEVERLARVTQDAGIIPDESGALRNPADLDEGPNSFAFDDAKIATKQAAIKIKQQSMAHLQQLAAQPDEDDADLEDVAEGGQGAGPRLSLSKQRQAQVAELAESVLAQSAEVEDDETRALIEAYGEALIADHDAAAKVTVEMAQKAKAKKLAAQAVETSINFAATLVDEPEARARELFELEQDIEEQGALEGWGQDRVAQEQTKARAQVHEQIVDTLVAVDPARARQWLTTQNAVQAERKDRLLGRVTVAAQAQETAKLADQLLASDEPLPSEQEFRDQILKDKSQEAYTAEVQGSINADVSSQYTRLVAARKKQEQARFADTSNEVQAGRLDPQKLAKVQDRQKADLILLHHENQVAARQGKARPTDAEMFGRLLGRGLRDFAETDLVAERSRLSEQDFQTMSALKSQLAEAGPRDRTLMVQYFAQLSDLAASADRHSARMDILEAGLAAFMEEGSVPLFERQTEMLDAMAKSYRLRPLGSAAERDEDERLSVADLPMPGDSQEELARKSAALDKRRDRMGGEIREPVLHPAINMQDKTEDEAFEEYWALIQSAGSEIARATDLKFRAQVRKEFGQFWSATRLGKISSTGRGPFSLKQFDSLMDAATVVGRRAASNVKNIPIEQLDAILGIKSTAVWIVESEGGELLKGAQQLNAQIEKQGVQRLILNAIDKDEIADFMQKAGRTVGRSLIVLEMAIAFKNMFDADFETDAVGRESGKVVGSLIGGALGGAGGLICALPCSIALGAVGAEIGSRVGGYAGEGIANWLEDDAVPFVESIFD